MTATGWGAQQSLTLTECATRAGMSRARIYDLAKAGDLPARRDAQRRLRVTPTDLEAFITARRGHDVDQPALFDLPEDGPQ